MAYQGREGSTHRPRRATRHLRCAALPAGPESCNRRDRTMFTRWLLNTLPAELSGAWTLVRVDLGLWIGLALIPALITAASSGDASSPSPALAVTTLLSLVIFSMLAAVKFDAARRNAPLDLTAAFGIVIRRVPPYLAAFAAVYTITLGAGWLAEGAVRQITRGTPVDPAAAILISSVIYISLLARYAFWPYLAVLDRGYLLPLEELAPKLLGPLGKPLARLCWPLMASTRLTEGVIWSLVPYVILLGVGPAMISTAPAAMRAPLMAVWWLVQLLLQAVLYNHYAARKALLFSASSGHSPD